MSEDSSKVAAAVGELSRTTYSSWAKRMELELQSYGDGNIWEAVKPASDAIVVSDLNNRNAIAILSRCLPDHFLDLVFKANTAKEAWSNIQSTFDTNTASTQVTLQHQLSCSQQGPEEESLLYVRRIESLSNQLKEAGLEVPARMLVIYVINGVRAEFRPQMDALMEASRLNPDRPLTLAIITESLTCAETRLKHDEHFGNSAALATRRDNSARQKGHDDRSRSRQPNPNRNKKCTYCNKRGMRRKRARQLTLNSSSPD